MVPAKAAKAIKRWRSVGPASRWRSPPFVVDKLLHGDALAVLTHRRIWVRRRWIAKGHADRRVEILRKAQRLRRNVVLLQADRAANDAVSPRGDHHVLRRTAGIEVTGAAL